MPLDNNPQIEQGDGGGSSSDSGSTSTSNSVANYYFKKDGNDERIDLSVLSSFHDSYQDWEEHTSHYKATYCSVGAKPTPYIENNNKVYAGWYNPNFFYGINRIGFDCDSGGHFFLHSIRLSWNIKNGTVRMKVGTYTSNQWTAGDITWSDPVTSTWKDDSRAVITRYDYLPNIQLRPGDWQGVRYRIQVEVWDDDASGSKYYHTGLDLGCIYMYLDSDTQTICYDCRKNLYGTNYYPIIKDPTNPSPSLSGSHMLEPIYLHLTDQESSTSYWSYS